MALCWEIEKIVTYGKDFCKRLTLFVDNPFWISLIETLYDKQSMCTYSDVFEIPLC